MPNSTVPAADLGLPNFNSLRAIATLGMAAVATAPQNQAVSQGLLRLIDEYRAAKKARSGADVNYADAEQRRNDRRSSDVEAAERGKSAAGAREDAALTALCAYRCMTTKDARIKANYLSSDEVGAEALGTTLVRCSWLLAKKDRASRG